MKKKFIKTLLIVALVSFSAFFASCNFHIHTFDSAYSYDKDYHYNKATCGCDLTSTKKEHVLENDECTICDFKAYYFLEYTITYIDELGATNVNPTTYVYNDGQIVLQDLTCVGYEFKGWYTGENGTGEKVTIVDCTITGAKTFYALWEEIFYYNLTLNLDGNEKNLDIEKGSCISKAQLNSLYDFASGYEVKDWYIDQNRTSVYDYQQQVYDNVLLYASVSYLTESLYFYDYLSEFAQAQQSKELEINSFNELKAYVDYVRFYDVANEVKLFLKYTNASGIDEINKAIAQKSEFECTSTLTKGTKQTAGKAYSYYYVSETNVSEQATKNADKELVNSGNQSKLIVQQDYALKTQAKNIRSNDYEGFALNSVIKSIPVYTEDQLYYAVEQGYKPNIIENSKAEIVYEKAKEILRSIITDDMSELEKVRLIYEWLILNVSYDISALDINDYKETRLYDDWFISGALITNIAVCDGISKSFVLLSKLEGIPCVRVTGNSHAWNKVYIDADGNGTREWYGVDATHGGVCFKSEGKYKFEVLTYSQFLFTDENKTSKGYSTTDYQSFIADTFFDYYSNFSFSLNSNEYDLVIENSYDLNRTLKAITKYNSDLDCEYYTVEFKFNTKTPTDYIEHVFGYSFNYSILEETTEGSICILFFENN